MVISEKLYVDQNILENDVSNFLISCLSDEDVQNILFKQINKLKLIKRTFTGCGFIIEYELEDENTNYTVCLPNFIGGVVGMLNNETMIDVHLHLKEDKIDYLEIVTYDGNWPEKIFNYRLSSI